MDFKKYLDKSMSYDEYWAFFENLVKEGKTNWHEPSEEMIQYTKLNFQRSKRVHNKFKLNSNVHAQLENLNEPITWLIITEPWCGDAAQNLPVFYELSLLSDLIELRVVLRDENPELMDAFLTNGTRSIPKVLQLDADMIVNSEWGPRPLPAQEMMMKYKLNPWTDKQNFYQELQSWYNSDRSQTVQNEIALMLMNSVNA